MAFSGANNITKNVIQYSSIEQTSNCNYLECQDAMVENNISFFPLLCGCTSKYLKKKTRIKMQVKYYSVH